MLTNAPSSPITRCRCSSNRSPSRLMRSWSWAFWFAPCARRAFSIRRSLSISAASRRDGPVAPIDTECTASSVVSVVRWASSSCAELHTRYSSRILFSCSRRTFSLRHSRSFSDSSSWTTRCSSKTSCIAASSDCAASTCEMIEACTCDRSSSKSWAARASLGSSTLTCTVRLWPVRPLSVASVCSSASTDSLVRRTRRPMTSTWLDSCMPSSQTFCSAFSTSTRRSWRIWRSCPRSHLSRSMSFLEYAWRSTCSVSFSSVACKSLSSPRSALSSASASAIISSVSWTRASCVWMTPRSSLTSGSNCMGAFCSSRRRSCSERKSFSCSPMEACCARSRSISPRRASIRSS
mmetsp:Transcript_31166/g.87792  ORF Transcript_31166/g.87792 Transcript_31166/m.87792 type:complete len:350 (-) Transcript_31166:574-1623(-)